MKIFIVCNSLGAGGAERVGVNLANGFVDHGYDAYIITDIYQKASYPVGKQVKVLPLCPKDKGKLQRWKGAIFNLRRYVKQEMPDVVIGIMHLCSLVARAAVIGLKIPVVMTIHHALESDTYQFSKVERFLDRHSLCLYKATTVLTQADKVCLQNHKNIFVMPNPLTFMPIKDLPLKEKIVLAAGRITDWRYKGWDVLLKAWASLTPLAPSPKGEGEIFTGEVKSFEDTGGNDWWLKIAGDGKKESFEYLMGLLPDAGWKPLQTSPVGRLQNIGWSSEKYRVEFLGYRTDMKDLFQKASIFVLSSRSEGLPMVLIEAMSQGCAPVATDFKGRTKEILGENGLCCAPEDVNALAVGMKRLMEDDELRGRMQKNAIERSKYYHIDHIIRMWKNLFKKMNLL